MKWSNKLVRLVSVVALALLADLGQAAVQTDKSQKNDDDQQIAIRLQTKLNTTNTKTFHENLDDFLHQVLLELSIDPNQALLNMKWLQEKKEKIHQCYDATVANHTVNIFQDDILVVVKKYFQTHKHLLMGVELSEMIRRIKTLTANIRYIGRRILECINAKDNSKFSRIGLTSLSAYSKNEYLSMLNAAYTKHKSASNETQPLYYTEPTLNSTEQKVIGHKCKTKPNNINDISKAFNWKDKGVVGPVKNQGNCLSCYVFASIAALESQYMLHVDRSKKISLSEQAVLNCLYSTGCNGGTIPPVFKQLYLSGTVEEDKSPYMNMAYFHQCDRNMASFIKIKNYCYIENLQSDQEIQTIVSTYGPSVTAIDASADDYQHLKGTYNGNCDTNVNHAVLTTGWDEKYWIIKNSWGPDWGIDGYLYLSRGENRCGVYQLAGVPLI